MRDHIVSHNGATKVTENLQSWLLLVEPSMSLFSLMAHGGFYATSPCDLQFSYWTDNTGVWRYSPEAVELWGWGDSD